VLDRQPKFFTLQVGSKSKIFSKDKQKPRTGDNPLVVPASALLPEVWVGSFGDRNAPPWREEIRRYEIAENAPLSFLLKGLPSEI
jgi:hypothetical protein